MALISVHIERKTLLVNDDYDYDNDQDDQEDQDDGAEDGANEKKYTKIEEKMFLVRKGVEGSATTIITIRIP